MLSLARVVDAHPESHAVDLLMMEDGRRIPGVPVMSGSAGTNFGFAGLVKPASVGYDAEKTGVRDIYAVVSWMRDAPIVLGFFYPQVAQCLFSDADRMIYRHASDVYVNIDGQGNTEISHPSGTFLKIGTSAAHEDLTGKDYDGQWKIAKNKDKAVHVQLTVKNAGVQKASVNIDPSGNVTLNHSGNLSTSTGGNLSASVSGTSVVNSSGNMSLTAPTITLNGNVVLNGPLTQGKGSGGGGCTMLGPVTVDGDVVAGGKSLMGHTHSGVRSGGDSSGPPN